MLKPVNQPRFSIPPTALLFALLAPLGACAAVDQSQRGSTPLITCSTSAGQRAESFFGYVKDPADHPAGPSFFGYVKDPADHPTGRSFFGYYKDPADHPTGPSFFGYHKDLVARSCREPQPPVAVRR